MVMVVEKRRSMMTAAKMRPSPLIVLNRLRYPTRCLLHLPKSTPVLILRTVDYVMLQTQRTR